MDNQPVVLIVDEEISLKDSYATLLAGRYQLLFAETLASALKLVQEKPVTLILLSAALPDTGAVEALQKIREVAEQDVVMLATANSIRPAMQAVQNGAFDVIAKPFDSGELLNVITNAITQGTLIREIACLKTEIKPCSSDHFIGVSPRASEVAARIDEFARSESPVMITGEIGTGKEVIARAIHRLGSRNGRPFVVVDCTRDPAAVETALFGSERNDQSSKQFGKLELADGGIVFLREVSWLTPQMQAGLLQALMNRAVRRSGGTRFLRIDVRIISSSSCDLKKLMLEGKFHQDLFFRLNALPLEVPPLRERADDIPLFIRHFVERYAGEYHRNVQGFSTEAMEMLLKYPWPGNIAELANVVERQVMLTAEPVISPRRLPIDIALNEGEKSADYYDRVSLRAARDEFETKFILNVMEKVRWNQTKAAKILGIHRNALLYKIREFHLRPILKKSKAKSRQAALKL